MLHTKEKLSDKPSALNTAAPITCPNTGTINAKTIIKIMANVNTIDNALVVIKNVFPSRHKRG